MEYLIVFIFGAIIGSFLNVCIYRIPKGQSIVSPGSFCPACGKTLKWYDNIPLVSFIALRGKCRGCRKRIPLRYFIVELVTALVSLVLLSFFGISISFFVYAIFACVLIVITFIDLDIQEIPDEISLPGIAVGLILVTVFKMHGTFVGSFANSAVGILVGGGSMFLLGTVGELLFKKEALGGGDIKLMGMIGAFLGWKLVLVTFFLAPVFGSICSIGMLLKKKKEPIAYGPYLAIGSLVSLLFGEEILGFLFVY